MNKLLKIRNRIIGIILIVINMYWFWHNLELAYLYRYSSVLFVIMLPDWLLTLNIIFSLIGIFFGIKITRKQLEIRKGIDRKSTRLNSSHVRISYAVFCLKKKRKRESFY